jgi:leucyl/phenylalanyl-tRNA---protein transferase
MSRPIEPPPSRFVMPDPALAAPGEDLIAIGADLTPGTLLAAYRAGLFPMPVDPRRRRSKIAWYSPDPRGIIPIDGLHVSRSLQRSFKRFEIRIDTAFVEVMRRCGEPSRPGRWITDQIVGAYTALHDLGWAHSIEVWRNEQLVGGLYGVRIGGLFAGESMFHVQTDASKVALMALLDWLGQDGAELLDVQWTTPHLRSLGAIDVERFQYLAMLDHAVGQPAQDRRA